MKSRVRELSKGMVTQLHLALILAIDARLLVLDEPTLGLDLLFRRQFYDTLLNDYFDKERTILLTTHQVEEIENLLTDVIFIHHGQIALDSSVEGLGRALRAGQRESRPGVAARASSKPFYEREVFGRVAMFFEGAPPDAARARWAKCARRPSPTCSSPRCRERRHERACRCRSAASSGSTGVLVNAPVALCVVYLPAVRSCRPADSARRGSTSTASASARVSRCRRNSRSSCTSCSRRCSMLLMAIVTFFYLSDCLYSERKDRSILFWKSLPVSDAVTVISKLLVALIAVPLVVYVLSLVTNLLAVRRSSR